MSHIIELIRQKKAPDQLRGHVLANPEEIEELIHVIRTEKGAIKYNCEKVLRTVSQVAPEFLYPHFDFFAELLISENNFLKWGAIQTLANLAGVDREGRFTRIFDRYFGPVTGPAMITAANTVKSAAKIAIAQPSLTDRIISVLLEVEGAEYQNKGEISPECKNIVCGEVIRAFSQLWPLTNRRPELLAFVRMQLQNTRPSVKKEAEKFIRKYAPGAGMPITLG